MAQKKDQLSFSLQLANHLSWQFMAFGEAIPWAKELAHIMRLKNRPAAKNAVKIFILSQDNATPPIKRLPAVIKKSLPQTDWQSNDDKIARRWIHPKTPHTIFELGKYINHDLEIIKMWRVLAPIYEGVIENGGLPFHAGLIVKNKQGFILSAPGGTGKSTCCRRVPKPWQAWCDDECLILPAGDGKYRVHPFPTWSDHLWKKQSHNTWQVEKSVSLAKIYFIEQAKKEKALPLTSGLSAVIIHHTARQMCQKNWPKLDTTLPHAIKHKLFASACALARSVACYRLKVAKYGTFWKKIVSA